MEFFSPVFQAVVAALVIQGLKAIFGWEGDAAKVAAVVVGALFFAVNGILAIFVTDPKQIQALQTIIGALLAVLQIFAPAGAYSAGKAIKQAVAARLG